MQMILKLMLKYKNIVKKMENFLNSIRNNEDVFANLTALNDLLKNNESLRRETPVCFYSVIKQLLNDLIEEKEKLNEENGKTLELAIKCLRNSSAAIAETAFSDDETDICKLLLSYLKQNLNNDNLNIIQHNNKNNCSSISSSSSGSSIFVHVMQYFFNLSQGFVCLLFEMCIFFHLFIIFSRI